MLWPCTMTYDMFPPRLKGRSQTNHARATTVQTPTVRIRRRTRGVTLSRSGRALHAPARCPPYALGDRDWGVTDEETGTNGVGNLQAASGNTGAPAPAEEEGRRAGGQAARAVNLGGSGS